MKERLFDAIARISPRDISLYIHFPFCAGKCDYCDFYSVPVSPDDDGVLDRYTDALRADIEASFPAAPPEIASVYIGGGTPSLLGPSRLAALLETLHAFLPASFPVSGPPREITLEANPESLDEGLLAAARRGGVTRLSLGVQSFHDESRRAAGRRGEKGVLREKLGMARDFFGRGLSLDMMSGLPFEDETSFLRGLDTALHYGPGHISLYSLTLEENTPLYRRVTRGEVNLPGEDAADRLWLLGRDALEAAGFSQYEVSNFALPGREALHNIRYWRMRNWIGLGPGASGTLFDDEKGEALRCTVAPDVEAYLDTALSRGAEIPMEHIDRPALIRESLLMGFRYAKGPDALLFRRRFGRTLEDLIPAALASWDKKGLLESGVNGGEKTWALTREGLLFLNRFLLDAFAELDRDRALQKEKP